MSRVAAISGSSVRLLGEREQENQLADNAEGGEKQGVRRGKRPCPLPRAGVLVAGYEGKAQDWSLSSLAAESHPLSVSRLISSTCNVRVRRGQALAGCPLGWGVRPMQFEGGGFQPSPQNASALPSLGWDLSGSNPSQSAKRNHKRSDQSEAKPSALLLRRGRAAPPRVRAPRGLTGLGVSLWRTKAT